MSETPADSRRPRRDAAMTRRSQAEGTAASEERERNGPVRGARPQAKTPRKDKTTDGGKLKIGDDWNAIRIIALSQSNPLKAIAEFVENSIDAHAKTITITRGREHGAHYLSIKDDGDGVPRDEEGLPNFKYVATHICDSIKRRLKIEGLGSGLQGEFGIGLLSFWTVGDTLTMASAGADQRAYQMTMSKGDSRYKVTQRRVLFAERGTELKISPLLEGIRTLSGEKIQWFLASELRDRLRTAQVRVSVIDKLARKQYEVEPRAYEGRLLHQLPAVRTAFGDAYAELYLAQPADSCRVALTRAGTRVIEDLATLPGLESAPWSSRYLQGLVDAPFLNLTPGTRSGVIHDERYAALLEALKPLEANVNALIEAQQRAEEKQASQQSLRAIQRAFREALPHADQHHLQRIVHPLDYLAQRLDYHHHPVVRHRAGYQRRLTATEPPADPSQIARQARQTANHCGPLVLAWVTRKRPKLNHAPLWTSAGVSGRASTGAGMGAARAGGREGARGGAVAHERASRAPPSGARHRARGRSFRCASRRYGCCSTSG